MNKLKTNSIGLNKFQNEFFAIEIRSSFVPYSLAHNAVIKTLEFFSDFLYELNIVNETQSNKATEEFEYSNGFNSKINFLIKNNNLRAYVTDSRLVILAKIPAVVIMPQVIGKGPKVGVSEDIKNRSLASFSTKNNIQNESDVDVCEENGVFIFKIKSRSVSTTELMSQKMPLFLQELSQRAWKTKDGTKKIMYCDNNQDSWVFPMKSIFGMLAENQIQFSYCNTKSSNQIHGNKNQYGRKSSIQTCKNASEYLQKMADCFSFKIPWLNLLEKFDAEQDVIGSENELSGYYKYLNEFVSEAFFSTENPHSFVINKSSQKELEWFLIPMKSICAESALKTLHKKQVDANSESFEDIYFFDKEPSADSKNGVINAFKARTKDLNGFINSDLEKFCSKIKDSLAATISNLDSSAKQMGFFGHTNYQLALNILNQFEVCVRYKNITSKDFFKNFSNDFSFYNLADLPESERLDFNDKYKNLGLSDEKATAKGADLLLKLLSRISILSHDSNLFEEYKRCWPYLVAYLLDKIILDYVLKNPSFSENFEVQKSIMYNYGRLLTLSQNNKSKCIVGSALESMQSLLSTTNQKCLEKNWECFIKDLSGNKKDSLMIEFGCYLGKYHVNELGLGKTENKCACIAQLAIMASNGTIATTSKDLYGMRQIRRKMLSSIDPNSSIFGLEDYFGIINHLDALYIKEFQQNSIFSKNTLSSVVKKIVSLSDDLALDGNQTKSLVFLNNFLIERNILPKSVKIFDDCVLELQKDLPERVLICELGYLCACLAFFQNRSTQSKVLKNYDIFELIKRNMNAIHDNHQNIKRAYNLLSSLGFCFKMPNLSRRFHCLIKKMDANCHYLTINSISDKVNNIIESESLSSNKKAQQDVKTLLVEYFEHTMYRDFVLLDINLKGCRVKGISDLAAYHEFERSNFDFN